MERGGGSGRGESVLGPKNLIRHSHCGFQVHYRSIAGKPPRLGGVAWEALRVPMAMDPAVPGLQGKRPVFPQSFFELLIETRRPGWGYFVWASMGSRGSLYMFPPRPGALRARPVPLGAPQPFDWGGDRPDRFRAKLSGPFGSGLWRARRPNSECKLKFQMR